MAYGNTEYIFVKGKLSWVRVVNFNQFGDWSATIHPDQESLETLRELQADGLKNVMKKDEEGYYMQFKCPPSKSIKGTVRKFTPPIAVDKDGNPFDGATIGNGSDGYLKLEVYPFKAPTGATGKAARLVGVRVDNLVPYDPKRDASERELGQMEGMADQKEMLF